MTRGFFASKASGFTSVADMQKSTKVIRFGSVDLLPNPLLMPH